MEQIRALLIIFVLVLSSTGAEGQSQPDDKRGYIYLRASACYVLVAGKPDPLDLPAGSFVCPGEAEPQLQPGDSVWFRLEDPRISDKARDWRLLVDFGRASAITVVARFADGNVWRDEIGENELGAHWSAGGYAALRIPAQSAPLESLFVGYQSIEVHPDLIRKLTLIDDDRYADNHVDVYLFYGIIIGIIFSVLLYNFALYLVLRLRFQLFYCLTSLSFLIYAITWPGFIFDIVPGLAMGDATRIAFIALGCGVGFSTIFFVHFMEREIYPRRVQKVFVALGGTVAVTSTLAAYPPPGLSVLATKAASFSVLLAVLVLLVALVWAIYKRSRAIWFFIGGWGSFMFGGILKGGLGSGLLNIPVHWADMSIFISMAVEALVLSFGIADRIRAIRSERDQATKQRSELIALAETDPLTGLANRHAVKRWFSGQFNTGERACGALVLDLDYFKRINDHYGHPVGDKALKAVADILQESCRAHELSGRLGGEEFIILMPGAEPIGVERLADRIRQKVASYSFDGFDDKLTISVGGAFLAKADAASYAMLYSMADEALYAAKGQGRDQSVMHWRLSAPDDHVDAALEP